MLFVDISQYYKGQQTAHEQNQEDLFDLQRFTAQQQDLMRKQQETNEFLLGAPGREAATNLESQRQVRASNLLRPQLGTLAQASANSALGNAQLRSLRGLYNQNLSQNLIPSVPTIAQANAENITRKATQLPQQQRLSETKTQLEQAVTDNQLSQLPQQQAYDDAVREYNLATVQGNMDRLPQQQELNDVQAQLTAQKTQAAMNMLNATVPVEQSQANIAAVRNSLGVLHSMDPTRNPEVAMSNAAQTTTILRNAGVIGLTDVVSYDPTVGWAVFSNQNGRVVKIPTGEVLAPVQQQYIENLEGKQFERQMLTPSEKEKPAPVKYTVTDWLDDEGNVRQLYKVQSEGEPPPSLQREPEPDNAIGDRQFKLTDQQLAEFLKRTVTSQNNPKKTKDKLTTTYRDKLLRDPKLRNREKARILSINPYMSGNTLEKEIDKRILKIFE